jgi:hypothetical protein
LHITIHMTKRTSNDTCLLCQKSKSDKKNSHYTPASIIKKVIGERDYEEIYSIFAEEASTSVFMGRANLLNTDTRVKKPEHMEDYIFCSECERRLGIIEGVCSQPLNSLVDELAKSNLKINRTDKGNKYIFLSNPHKNILTIYFYSIVWRQCIQQQLMFDSIILTQLQQDFLRDIIYQEIYKQLPEIRQTDMSNFPPLTILTTYHHRDLTACFINPNLTQSNPYLFFIGPYELLIWEGIMETNEFNKATALADQFKDQELRITASRGSLIGVITELQWQKTIKRLVDKVAEKYINKYVSELSLLGGSPNSYTRMVLLSETNGLYFQGYGGYVKCLDEAYRQIKKHLKLIV